MDFLYFLEKIRVSVLDEFMLLVTRFGEETAFLVAALIVFWCVDKKKGYFILAVGFIGTITSQFMKLLCRVPRPWIIDKDFTIVEQAREAADGYSFPSGHSQSAVGTFGGIGAVSKNKWVRIGAFSIAVLVPFSRMYLGVHTPQDVIVGSLIAVLLIFTLKPIIFSNNEKAVPILLCVMTAMAIGYTCYVELYPFPANMDAHNLASGIQNAYTLLGALSGFLVVYIVDEKWLNFSTKAIWWAQILKVVLGLVVVLVVKSCLKEPLNAFLGEFAGRAFRYFLVVISAGLLWPLTFKMLPETNK